MERFSEIYRTVLYPSISSTVFQIYIYYLVLNKNEFCFNLKMHSAQIIFKKDQLFLVMAKIDYFDLIKVEILIHFGRLV